MLTISDDAKYQLIRLVAQTDAIFYPLRDQAAPYWSTVWTIRDQFFRIGLAWRSGADGSNDAKTAERSLQKLDSLKLIQRVRPHGSKTLFIKISGDADQYGRALAGVASAADSVEFCKRLYALDPDGWVREIDLTDGLGWGDGRQTELALSEMLQAPGAARRWIESNSTVHGHVCYWLTDLGREIATGDLDPGICPKLPDKQENGFKTYLAELGNARATLRSRDDNLQDIGQIPLSMADIS